MPSYKYEYDFYDGDAGNGFWSALLLYDDGVSTTAPGYNTFFPGYTSAICVGTQYASSYWTMEVAGVQNGTLTPIPGQGSGGGITSTNPVHYKVYLLKGQMVIAQATTKSPPASYSWTVSTNFSNLLKQTADPTHPRCLRTWTGSSNNYRSDYSTHAKNITVYSL